MTAPAPPPHRPAHPRPHRPRPTRLRPAFASLLLLATLLTTGCGYRSSELFPTTYASVAVPVFQNQTFFRGLEFDLTEALIKELEQRTPYRTQPPARADTLLQGTITSVQTRRLSRTRGTGLPQEVELEVTLNFTWTDQATGQVIVDRRGFSGVGRYIPRQPVGETYDVGQQAAAQRLARDIVSSLRGDW